ncbi:MAG: hypothetical protein EA349_14040 [Halomonadaceae bacterium]|nr:MAG: hypothetical protein EA349_14040 [Halomonadaceae bacterium]
MVAPSEVHREQRPGLSRHRHPQGGAISVMAAGMLILAIMMLALTVDTARLLNEQRQLGTAADAAALAAIDSFSQGPAKGDPEVARQSGRSLAGQNVAGVDDVSFEFGRVDTRNGLREFSADGSGLAIKAIAENQTPFSIVANWLLPGQASLRAESVAFRPRVTTLSVGSSLAALGSEDSFLLDALLGGLLGTDLNLDLVSYNALANTRIQLIELVELQPGVGTVAELLDARISLADLVSLTARAVGNDMLAEVALTQIGASGINPALDLRMGDLFSISQGAEAGALGASVDAFSLLQLGAQVANEGNLIDLQLDTSGGLLAGLGLLDLNLTLNIIEAPEIAIGPAGRNQQGEWLTQAQTGQLQLRADLQAVDIDVLSLVGVSLGAGIEIATATATAQVEDVTLEQGQEVVRVGAQSSVATVDANVDLELQLLALIGGGIPVGVGIPASLSLDGAQQTLLFSAPFGDSAIQGVGVPLGPALRNDFVDELALELSLGLGDTAFPVPLPLNGIVNVAGDVVGGVITVVLDPLLSVLGTELGAADVQVHSVNAGASTLIQ